MAIVLSAIVVLLPLILTPHWLFYYDITPKVFVLVAGTAIALIFAWRGERAQSPGLRAFGLLLVAQAGSLALSTVFSIDAEISLGGSTWRRFGLVTQVAMLIFVWLAAQHAAGDPLRVRRWLRAIAAAGVAAAAYGILQYFGWDPLIDPAAYHIGEPPLTIVRPPGTLGYASYFATYLLAVIFAGAGLIAIEESRGWKLLGAAAGILGTAALSLTGTRAAMLGLACGAVFLAFRLRPRIRARELAASLAALAAFTGFYVSPAGQMLRNRTRWYVEDPVGGSRLLLWRDALRMAGARWPVGFGPETFPIRFPQYQSAELARAYPDFYQESPHNIFIDALAGQGLPGVAVLAGVTFLGFYAIRKAPARRLASALGAALVAMLASQQFTSFTLPTALFFYLTVALLVAQVFVPVPLQAKGRRGAVIFASGIVSLLFFTFALSLLAADATLARVSRLIRGGKPREAGAVYQQLQRWQPPGVRTDLWYSRAMGGASTHAQNRLEAIAEWQEALAAAVRASRNAEDRQNAWLNLATFYGRQNDFPHTEQSLRAAIAFAPNWFKPHWLLAQVLRIGGRLEEARREASLAVDLDGGKDPEVARTAVEITAAIRPSEK